MRLNIKLKFKKILFCLLLLSMSNNNLLYCNNEEPDFEEIIDLSDIDWDNIDTSITKQGNPGPVNLDALLVAAATLNAPVWNYTKPPKGRDVLYLIPHRILAIEHGGLILNLFYNYTPDMNYTLEEIINLDDNKVAFENAIKAINQASPDDVSSLIPLFKKSVIEERKGGGLLQAGFYSGPFIFQLNTSIQFSERNFWLNPKDQDEIKRILASDGSTLKTKEFYKYKVGMGDTRLKAGLNTLNMSNFVMDLGFEGIIPTSRISNIPNLKSYNIDYENFDKTLIEALRSIRDNMINPRLGNNGHLGLGCYMEAKIDLFHDSIHWWNRLSFDNFFVTQEDRLIASKQTYPAPLENFPDAFNYIAEQYRDHNNPVPVTEFLKQFLFPPAYRVTIHPGGIFNFVSALTFSIGKKWNIGAGYDYYFQQEESIDAVHDDVNLGMLKINEAALPSSDQHKIFGEITYIQKYKDCNLNLGIGGDYTVSSKRMGEDWTLFLRIGVAF